MSNTDQWRQIINNIMILFQISALYQSFTYLLTYIRISYPIAKRFYTFIFIHHNGR